MSKYEDRNLSNISFPDGFFIETGLEVANLEPNHFVKVHPSAQPSGGGGSGIYIGEGLVLTASHVVYDDMFQTVEEPNRAVWFGHNFLGNSNPIYTNADKVEDVSNFNLEEIQYLESITKSTADIALITTNEMIDAPAVSFAIFENETNAAGDVYSIGYPVVGDRSGFFGGLFDNRFDGITPHFGTGTLLGRGYQPNSYFTDTGDADASFEGIQPAWNVEMPSVGGQSGSGNFLSYRGPEWLSLGNSGALKNPKLIGVTSLGDSKEFGDNDFTAISPLSAVYNEIADYVSDEGLNPAGFGTHTRIADQSGGNAPVQGTVFDEVFIGSAQDDVLIGKAGSNTLIGGPGDDNLVGGDAVDVAVYLGPRDQYEVGQTGPDTYQVAGGLRAIYGPEMQGPEQIPDPGTDTLTGIERVRFSDAEFAIEDLVADPVLRTDSVSLFDDAGARFGSLSFTAPAQSMGTEAPFSINLSTAAVGLQYNIALVVDVSGSMRGSRLANTKEAFEALLNDLDSKGIGDVANFGVIPFAWSASLYDGLTVDETIDRINGLSAGGGTNFGRAIDRAEQFFDSASTNATNITYFLSDGFGSGARASLQDVSDVRAFGVGNADMSSLNLIDSREAKSLDSASDLVDSFAASNIAAAEVDEISIMLNGVVVKVISGESLVDQGSTGLTYDGLIENFDRDAADTVDVQVRFQDASIPAQDLTFIIGDGNESISNGTATMGNSQRSIEVTEGIDRVIGNNLSNIINMGQNNGTVETGGGNNRVFLGDNSSGALDRTVIGGSGLDFGIYDGLLNDYNLSLAGSLVRVGSNTDSLSGIEFLQFDDAVVDTSDLSTLPTLSIDDAEVIVDDTTSTISFTARLDEMSDRDISFSYSTENGSATAGEDFTAALGDITLEAGETEAVIEVGLPDDITVVGEIGFTLRLTDLKGAVFDTSTPHSTARGVLSDGNTPAEISGDYVGSVVEDDSSESTSTGQLVIFDPDEGEAVFEEPDAESLEGTYGDFSFDSQSGVWSYDLVNERPIVQALGEGRQALDFLTVSSVDGTASETIAITVTGVNDPAAIAGDNEGVVTEGETEAQSAAGVLTVTDPDAGEARFQEPELAAFQQTYGSFSFNPDTGEWAYDLNSDDEAFKALADGEEVTDNLTVTSLDGTVTETISVTVVGAGNPKEDEATLIVGTALNDTLVGTVGDDLFKPVGGALNTLTGNGGADVFDFRDFIGNGTRDVANVMDFEVGVDSLGLDPDDIAASRSFAGNTYLNLTGGENDMIVLQGVDSTDELIFV